MANIKRGTGKVTEDFKHQLLIELSITRQRQLGMVCNHNPHANLTEEDEDIKSLLLNYGIVQQVCKKVDHCEMGSNLANLYSVMQKVRRQKKKDIEGVVSSYDKQMCISIDAPSIRCSDILSILVPQRTNAVAVAVMLESWTNMQLALPSAEQQKGMIKAAEQALDEIEIQRLLEQDGHVPPTVMHRGCCQFDDCGMNKSSIDMLVSSILRQLFGHMTSLLGVDGLLCRVADSVWQQLKHIIMLAVFVRGVAITVTDHVDKTSCQDPALLNEAHPLVGAELKTKEQDLSEARKKLADAKGEFDTTQRQLNMKEVTLKEVELILSSKHPWSSEVVKLRTKYGGTPRFRAKDKLKDEVSQLASKCKSLEERKENAEKIVRDLEARLQTQKHSILSEVTAELKDGLLTLVSSIQESLHSLQPGGRHDTNLAYAPINGAVNSAVTLCGIVDAMNVTEEGINRLCESMNAARQKAQDLHKRHTKLKEDHPLYRLVFWVLPIYEQCMQATIHVVQMLPRYISVFEEMRDDLRSDLETLQSVKKALDKADPAICGLLENTTTQRSYEPDVISAHVITLNDMCNDLENDLDLGLRKLCKAEPSVEQVLLGFRDFCKYLTIAAWKHLSQRHPNCAKLRGLSAQIAPLPQAEASHSEHYWHEQLLLLRLQKCSVMASIHNLGPQIMLSVVTCPFYLLCDLNGKLHSLNIEARQALKKADEEKKAETMKNAEETSIKDLMQVRTDMLEMRGAGKAGPEVPAGLLGALNVLDELHATIGKRGKGDKFVAECSAAGGFHNPLGLTKEFAERHQSFESCQERIRSAWVKSEDDEPLERVPSRERSESLTNLPSEVKEAVKEREAAAHQMVAILDKLEQNVYQRLAARVEFLNGVTSRLNRHIPDLNNLNDMNDCVIPESTEHNVGAESTKRAIAAFAEWQRSIDAGEVMAATDVVMRELGQMLGTHLCFDEAEAGGDAQWALAEKLKEALTICEKEKSFWRDDPLDSLPEREIFECARRVSETFAGEVAELKSLLRAIEDGRAVVADIKQGRAGGSLAEKCSVVQLYELEDELDDVNEKLNKAAQDVENLQLKESKARKRGTVFKEAEELERAGGSLGEIKRKAVRISRELTRERGRLQQLNREHFPEMAIQEPGADLLGHGDLHGVVQCNFEAFDVITRTIKSGNHPVHVTSLQGEVCVLKEFNCSQADWGKFQKEAKRMHGLNHPAIIKLQSMVYSIKDKSKIYLQMPYYEGGTIAEWIRNHNPTSEKLREVLFVVLTGIAHLHCEGIIHCDIKLDNILMTVDDGPSATPVISDFDISKENEERSMTTAMSGATKGGGTLAYMAPEVQPLPFGLGQRQTAASDMFAFGVVVFNAFFPGRYDELAAAAAAPTGHESSRAGGALAWPFEIPVELRDPDEVGLGELLSCLLVRDPSKRPCASDLLGHRFIATESLLREREARAKRAEEEKAELERRVAAEREEARREAAAAEAARQRDCVVCGDSLSVAEGIECGNDNAAHFLCRECLCGHVRSQSEDHQDLLLKRGGRVFCPMRQGEWVEGEWRPNRHSECSGGAYSDAEIARHAPTAFGAYMDAKKRLVEQKLSREIEATQRERFERELKRLQQMDDEQREIYGHKREIERMLNLQCPRCSGVFYDFNGCLALTCGGCGCGFCGWCLVDCGTDAHAHVANCRLNPKRGNVFGDVDVWRNAHRERQTGEIRSYVSKLAQHLQPKVLESARQQLIDANMAELMRGLPTPPVVGIIDIDAELAQGAEFDIDFDIPL